MVAAYILPSGPIVRLVYCWPFVVACGTFSNATVGSTGVVSVPVVKLIVNGTNAEPAVSRRPSVTSNVYCVLASSIPAGVSVIESPPPEVLTLAETGAWSLVR
jgi:hypothetical protein